MKEVYTLADLESRALLDVGVDKPARLAVIGHPIAHSASPRMHQAALDGHGENIRYIRLDIEPGQVGEAFRRMRSLGFIGCNVTVPHKMEAMAHCEVQLEALPYGAVNTIHFLEQQTLGYNTDAPGFGQALVESLGFHLMNSKVCIVGAGGGAGSAIAMHCVIEKAHQVILVNRSIEKLVPLIDRLNKYNSHTEIIPLSFEDLRLEPLCRGSELIVNTSSVGLKEGDPSILPAACLVAGQFVYDTIYQPSVTPLLAMADSLGCRTANGLSMLINQGAIAYATWFPGSHPLPLMEREMSDLTA